MDTRRAVSFMMRSRMLTPSKSRSAQIMRDIDSLDRTPRSCSTKINFLMDAGRLINITTRTRNNHQVFSVASARCCRRP